MCQLYKNYIPKSPEEALDGDYPQFVQEIIDLRARLEKAEKDAEAKQARIDELMLEYCPDEMTPEQMEEWARNQKPVIEAITSLTEGGKNRERSAIVQRPSILS